MEDQEAGTEVPEAEKEAVSSDKEVARCQWICKRIIEDGYYKYLVRHLKFLEHTDDSTGKFLQVSAHISLANRLFKALENDDFETQRRWSCCVGLPLLLRDDAERVSKLLAERRGKSGEQSQAEEKTLPSPHVPN